jgi:hypothetical protein
LEHGEGIHHVEAKRNVLEIVLAPSWLHETPVDCPELIKLVILQTYTIASNKNVTMWKRRGICLK